jgi:hypothetical protein
VVATPFGVVAQLFGDPLQRKRQRAASAWTTREGTRGDLEAARRQY